MALFPSSFACLSFVQAYFDAVKLVFTSVVGAYTQYPRAGLKRITPSDVRNDGDLSHHLCQETRERKPNAIKNVWRMAQAKGPGKVITLANGKLSSPLVHRRSDRLISFPCSESQAIHMLPFTQSGRSNSKSLLSAAPIPFLNGATVLVPPR